MPNPPGGRSRAGLTAASGMWVLATIWLLLAAAAWIYAGTKGIPAWAAIPVAAAFLIEIPFYLSPGVASARDWLTGLGKARAACTLTITGLIPWLIYSIPTGEAQFVRFALLLGVVLVVAFWYLVFPAAPAADLLFLVAIAAIYLSKIFSSIYVSPIPRQDISVLGHLMLIRTAALAVLCIRGNVTVEYRFFPTRKEWGVGLRYFVVLLPVIATVYWALGLVQWRTQPKNLALMLGLAAGRFLLILWVVALSEEFFFRGLLQQWIEKWTNSPVIGLILASALFGSAHLGFHHKFPNWQWTVVAGILGIFCGLAWRNTRTVQSAMVTHALTVTVWFVFLQ